MSVHKGRGVGISGPMSFPGVYGYPGWWVLTSPRGAYVWGYPVGGWGWVLTPPIHGTDKGGGLHHTGMLSCYSYSWKSIKELIKEREKKTNSVT